MSVVTSGALPRWLLLFCPEMPLQKHSAFRFHTVLISREHRLRTARASKTCDTTLNPEQEGQSRLLTTLSSAVIINGSWHPHGPMK